MSRDWHVLMTGGSVVCVLKKLACFWFDTRSVVKISWVD